jgi:hypothetical protein
MQDRAISPDEMSRRKKDRLFRDLRVTANAAGVVGPAARCRLPDNLAA